MPANLTQQYHHAEERYRQAKTTEEKLKALQEMMAVIPKHKGTEKLQADIKRRIARLKEEGQKKKQSKGGYNPFGVEKQGAGQIVLAGYPNCGKSALVGALTRAKVKVADYPFSTPLPVSGMMPYEDIYIQLVDTPPLTSDNVPPGLLGTFREADALLLVIDCSTPECLDQLEGLLEVLQEREVIDLSEEGEIIAPVPFMVLAAKIDKAGSEDNLEVLRQLRPELEIAPVSAYRSDTLEPLKEKLFALLNIIRIYGKAPGRPAEMEQPFILRKGSTVLDFAGMVHKDFPQRLKSALVWGSSRFDGQAVPRDYVLEDRDVVELQL
ncbi:MAG TPA: 50S ribosome-binding GTPase [Bacillota bacterium]|nr:50S ribosome-binding GTPase [Bacillota bacterium]